jgi:hypothetical protein
VETKEGGTNPEIHMRGLEPAARSIPPDVAPDLKIQNLGELKTKNGSGMLASFTDLPRCAMIVTAEPYFALKRPSDYIVLYNLWRLNTEENCKG